ncbi:uncharacterized protein LOC118603942 [Rousettus aegyptiacus]|uniref:uncharacterized protein LOC118603942 n=1 Tax=Rousettus aegyptiacus TaxID=9407 RepID=UPI00168D6C47|nr:uncharacterized protein LOC118603942 [Rousettus aegyptiacus]
MPWASRLPCPVLGQRPGERQVPMDRAPRVAGHDALPPTPTEARLAGHCLLPFPPQGTECTETERDQGRSLGRVCRLPSRGFSRGSPVLTRNALRASRPPWPGATSSRPSLTCKDPIYKRGPPHRGLPGSSPQTHRLDTGAGHGPRDTRLARTHHTAGSPRHTPRLCPACSPAATGDAALAYGGGRGQGPLVRTLSAPLPVFADRGATAKGKGRPRPELARRWPPTSGPSVTSPCCSSALQGVAFSREVPAGGVWPPRVPAHQQREGVDRSPQLPWLPAPQGPRGIREEACQASAWS